MPMKGRELDLKRWVWRSFHQIPFNRKDLVWFRQKGGCEMLRKRHRRMGQCVGGPAWGERPQRFVAEWLVRVWLWLVPNF